MMTAKYVREHLKAIKESMKRRHSEYPIDELLKLDEQSRKLNTELQELRAKRNKGSLAVAEMKKAKKNADREIRELAEVKEKIEELEAATPSYDDRLNSLLLNMPNTLDPSVPYGKDEASNVEVRRWGTPKKKKAANHADLLKKLGLLDLEKASEVAGARFYYLKGDLALLEQALIRFSIDHMVKKGYTLIAPPLMLRKKYYQGTTALGDFEEVLYKVSDPAEVKDKTDLERMVEELFLISTSEHAMAALVSEGVFSSKELPIKMVGVSPNFRREAGAHGKDSKGIFRVHQFYKVEQFVVSRQEDSHRYFDEMMVNAEEIFKKLEIPYRVVNICTGEIGVVAAKKFDLEAHMPASGEYRELVSCSNCTDWQALRLDIKYDEGGERRFAHTLNSTVSGSIERMMVAIVENYSNDDGTITIPDALVSYMNGKKKIG
jgi:seryl-tRNA synthetase